MVLTIYKDKIKSPRKKFSGRCRLFVGNLSPETTEAEFTKMFTPYGECSEVFLNAGRSFGFVRMDLRENAEKAKRALDGVTKRGRMLRVRIAAHNASIRVKHLHPFVSNELLHDAFSMFGEIERSVVCIDDKGKPTGEGIVEFARKPGAVQALKRVNEGIFLVGSSPRPVLCELLEHIDEEDGMPDIFLSKNNDYIKEREAPPRFASQGSFEFSFAQKWKELYKQHDQRKKQLEDEFQDAVARLELDESTALMEHQTAMLREDLIRRQEELRRMEEQHQMELQRKLDQRRQQDEIRRQMEEDKRREEEARMFMQQELAMRQMRQEEEGGHYGGQGGNAPPMQPPPTPPVSLAGPMGNRGRGPNEMGPPPNMGNRGMPQMHHGDMQGASPQQQHMLNMRGGRKGDSDYRQSRFDQPPPQFNQQNMGGGGGNMMFGGPQGIPVSMGGGFMPAGGPIPQGNMGQMQGNMGIPQVNMGVPQGFNMGPQGMGPPQENMGPSPGNMGGNMEMSGSRDMGPPMMRGGQKHNDHQEDEDYIENKRNRRY